VTNNSQKVYLDPPTNEGDDETTIIFTSNMNRIVEPDDNRMAENQGSSNLTTIITGIIKTMRQVPDDHYVWKYRDPTRTYYVLGLDEDQHGDNPLDLLLRPHTHQALHQFLDWYERQLLVTYELRQTITPTLPQVKPDSPVLPTEDEGSSTAIESSSSATLTWGHSHVRNHAEELKQWQESPTRDTLKDNTQRPV
jgi:hypothetical protein